MKRTIEVNGVHCGGCEARLGRTLNEIPGVVEVTTARPAENKEDECRGYAIINLAEDATLTDDELKAALEAGNFEVISIR